MRLETSRVSSQVCVCVCIAEAGGCWRLVAMEPPTLPPPRPSLVSLPLSLNTQERSDGKQYSNLPPTLSTHHTPPPPTQPPVFIASQSKLPASSQSLNRYPLVQPARHPHCVKLSHLVFLHRHPHSGLKNVQAGRQRGS